jgi:hypothetical protein
MEVQIEVWLPLLITIGGFVLGYFKYITDIQVRLSRMETKVDLFWGALESNLPGVLLKGNPLDHNSRVAILLTQFKEDVIKPENYPELVRLLENEVNNDDHTPGEKLAMIFMVATVKQRMISKMEH